MTGMGMFRAESTGPDVYQSQDNYKKGNRRDPTMLFCPTCTNLLVISADSGRNKWACNTCAYEFPIENQVLVYLSDHGFSSDHGFVR